MKISVLMSTYNGEKFIEEQMISIIDQTKRPDEVIIVDDWSTDSTIEIAEKVIRENDLEEDWNIFRNEKNIGWRINFINGIKHITGDILFFSDQDDIWFKNKIETYCDIFNSDATINIIVSKETLWTSETARPMCCIDDSNYSMIELSKREDNYLIHTSGCCMAIRMDYVRKMLPYCFPGWAHDDFFWKMGILDGSLAYMNTSSILHRITGTNESRKRATLEKAIWGAEIDVLVAQKLLQRLANECVSNMEEKRVILNHKLDGSNIRLRMLKSKNPLLEMKLMIKYSDLYRKKRQIVGDYLRAIHVIR